jgi:4-hydroxy-3-polyprenylbenzoate decarboxylase
MTDVVVGITGASGAVYATRLLEMLLRAGRRVHLTISPAGVEVLKTELGVSVDLEKFDGGQLGLSAERGEPGTLAYHHYRDYSAPIASGSFLTAGMVICPCSMGTLASVANGLSTNLIQRAADVHLKERRKLIVVPRETPLGSIQLENMKRLSDAGAVVLAAMPGFYHQPKSISDLVDFVVGRILDQLGVEKDLIARWGDPSGLPAPESAGTGEGTTKNTKNTKDMKRAN